MTGRTGFSPTRSVAGAAALIALSGCATTDLDRSIAAANRTAQEFTADALTSSRKEPQRVMAAREAEALLATPLTLDAAVRVALLHGPDTQTLLADAFSQEAAAAQQGRIANPVLSYERTRVGGDVDIERVLSLGLLDLLTLPRRQTIAREEVRAAQAQFASRVVRHVTAVREAWVRAVAAGERQRYAVRVYEAAEASAELAARMEAAGNFNRLQRARQQAFYADAATELAASNNQATLTREALARTLGLAEAQLQRLQLPERLPDLPAEPRTGADVSAATVNDRLDVRIAEAQFAAAAAAQGLGRITTLTDVELGGRRTTMFEENGETRSTGRGYALDVTLPLFDWGGLQRSTLNARTLAAGTRLESALVTAGSRVRTSYSAYRTAYDVARHFRDEIVPLRKLISEENLLRYNGMLIGVFELLADAREQTRTVMAAIDASERFWLADGALRAVLIGVPVDAPVPGNPAGASPASDAPH